MGIGNEDRGVLSVLGLGLAIAMTTVPAAAARADMVGHGGMIRSVAVSADGAQVLTASFDYSARLWRFDEQAELVALQAHDGPVNAAVFLPGRAEALTVGADGKLVHWRLEKGTPIAEMAAHAGRAMAVAASADGARALTGGWDGRVVLWDLARQRRMLTIETGAPVGAVAFVDKGRAVVSGGSDGDLRLWRLRDGVALGRVRAHDLGLTALTVSADGRHLLSIGLDDAVRLWDLGRLRTVSELTPVPGRYPLAAALAPDGRSALLSYMDGTVLQLALSGGTILKTIQTETRPVWSVAFSPDGRFALTAGVDERVKVWHLETGDRISVAGADELDARPRPWLASNHPGARLFRKCAGCHALGAGERQRSGPHFTGLFGRRAGSVAGYRYSRALDGSSLVWSRETLTKLFDLGPDRFLPGTKMPVQRITDGAALGHLIDYLQRIAPPG